MSGDLSKPLAPADMNRINPDRFFVASFEDRCLGYSQHVQPVQTVT